jgi:hypothetical protein
MYKRFLTVSLATACLFSAAGASAQAPEDPVASPAPMPMPAQPSDLAPAMPSQPRVEKIGEGVYRIGSITLYKRERRFTVPGRILRSKPPLEFLVIAKGGHKGYESLIELDTDAYLFNLACILTGLEAHTEGGARYHFDERPMEGPEVDLSVSWEVGGQRQQVPAEALLTSGGVSAEAAPWVYTGSRYVGDGIFLAAQDGTLVGFVHDPASIIEHKTGLGLGNFGAIAVSAIVPDVGTPIELTVSAKGASSSP